MRLISVLMLMVGICLGADGYISTGVATWSASTDNESGVAAYRVYYAPHGTSIDTKTTPYIEVGNDVLSYDIKSLPIEGDIDFCIAARDNGWNVSSCVEVRYFLDLILPTQPANVQISHSF